MKFEEFVSKVSNKYYWISSIENDGSIELLTDDCKTKRVLRSSEYLRRFYIPLVVKKKGVSEEVFWKEFEEWYKKQLEKCKVEA